EPATLFVGRLSWNIDDEWLRREFEPLGGVISARVIMERATGKSRGYGYVDFDSKSAAEKALNEYQGRELDGRPINLDMSTGKPHVTKSTENRAKQYGDTPSAPSDTLFIGNLSFNADRDNLFNIFGVHGTVISCRIPTHPDTQQPKGFGYVQFSSVDEAKAAMEALNGEYIEGRACRLDFSTPKDPSSSGNRGGFGGNRGGFGGNRGGFDGNRGGFGGRERSSTPTPTRSGPKTAEFKGTKKTFD
ncbi:nuclear localization sequence binding protein, partial [Scheffersomyces stipitis CBS 6054]